MLIIIEHKGQKITIDTGITEAAPPAAPTGKPKSPAEEAADTALLEAIVRGLFSESEGAK